MYERRIKQVALSGYQLRALIIITLRARARVRDKAIRHGAGRRNSRERTRLSAVARISSRSRSLLFPSRAYVGHVFRRRTFEDIDSRISPSVAVVVVATSPAGNYSYSLFGRVLNKKPSREMQNVREAGMAGGRREMRREGIT